ncbi:MAG: hypothetical protein KAG56_09330 [Sulfurovaceae bacterium]|nr:hypothetical protein [Sulfurovaceae bacterium]
MKKIVTPFVLVTVLILSPAIAPALEMSDCDIGRTVYIDELIDIEAKVIKKDYSDNTVKVKLNSGETRWVKPSDLMGRFGKEVEDYAEEKIVDFVFGCLFGDTCKKSN